LSFNSSSTPLVRKPTSNFRAITLENGDIYDMVYLIKGIAGYKAGDAIIDHFSSAN